MNNDGRPVRELAWCADGEQLFASAVAAVDDWSAPSRCPGWSRRTLLAHVANNADALVNLTEWARTGVETPMYASPEAREVGIAETAARPVVDILAAQRASAARLQAALAGLPPAAWAAQIRTAQGREMPATIIPWMRCREVWLHAVDLDAGPDPLAQVLPAGLAALVDDVFTMWDRRSERPDLRVVATDEAFHQGADAAGTVVEAPFAELVGWLTGRGPEPGTRTGPAVVLPAWL